MNANDTTQAAGARFDVCNGDADGLCALVQWRLHEPAPSTLVTGLKREIALLERVDAGNGDEVLVLDLSMQRNHQALLRLLERGARVRYFDHHAVSDIPRHPRLDAHIDMSAGVCTSGIVDRHLGGVFRAWAAVGAYGDNLQALGERLAGEAGIDAAGCERLRLLGEAINYNAYGEHESDVRIAPAALYPLLVRHREPLAFFDEEPIAAELVALRATDLACALDVPAYWSGTTGSIHVLPDAAWSRRVIGSAANAWAVAAPSRAHAVLRRRADGSLVASVRAPLDSPSGAGDLCARFGGSGREGAGGIDRLPVEDLDRFVHAFARMDWGRGDAS
ncbi:MAG: hypothetical protein ROZ64_15615 [Burkholderiaceae bacterium]|nr:hypothetical protein [Burkholderiaceae bacterium]